MKILITDKLIADEDLRYVEDVILPDSSLYSGQVMKSSKGNIIIKHGKGTQVWKDGAKYQGDWRKG